jgi:sigma-54 dependent transcriptional regulator, acetoin dehydrogenase operon transcriptional activator AcoR
MTKIRPMAAEAQTARQLFFDRGRIPKGCLPDVILRSWQRCSQHLDNSHAPPPCRVDSDLLNERREAQGLLRRIVQPEMDALAELVSESDSLVLLADEEGLILDAVGGLNFLQKAQQVYLQSGVHWSEAARGTNAIGTALIEGHPVLVKGQQHYLEANGILSCAAAPIFSPQGKLLGVLDVSGDSEQMHNQALGMVRLAIQIIEHRFAKTIAESATLLRFHHQSALLNSHREGLLILDDTQIIGANRSALQMLNTNWQELLDTPVENWLRLPAQLGKQQSKILENPLGMAFHIAHDSRRSTQVPVDINLAHDQEKHYFDDETLAKLEKARRLLDADIALLITGETGTGKEVFARRLHALCQRSQGPFVAVNCAALPESLIESELFGYAKGAFTGARRQGMPGRVREADGGILFLDEIGDMPLALQARLLRVLQEREVQPLGGGKSIAVNFSLICATNRDLSEMVSAGTFRADLYYRIQDFTIQLPPLRERQDVSLIARALLSRLGGERLELSFSEQAMGCMNDYHWPGNLRQLNSTLRMLIALSDPGIAIGVNQLPAEISCLTRHQQQHSTLSLETDDLQTQTDQAIRQALMACDGCISAAARRLNIHRSTLYRWLAKNRH